MVCSIDFWSGSRSSALPLLVLSLWWFLIRTRGRGSRGAKVNGEINVTQKKNGEQTGPERDRSGGTRLPPRRHSFVSAKLNTIEDDEEFLNGRRGSAHWCLWSERNFEVGTPSQSKWQHAVRLRSILLFCSSNWNQHLARSFSQLDKYRMPWRISPCRSCLLTQEGDRMLPFPPPGTSTQCEASPPLLLAVRPLISFWPHRAENHPTADSFAIRR